MDTFYHGEPSPSPHQHQHHHDPYEHGGDEDHDHDGIPPPYEDTEEAPPEIETAYSEARARGLPDGWTCSIDVCITGSLMTTIKTITISCRYFAHFVAVVVIAIVDDYKLFFTAETESS